MIAFGRCSILYISFWDYIYILRLYILRNTIHNYQTCCYGIFFKCMFVYVCARTHTCVHTHVWRHTGMNCTWRPEVNIRHLPQLLSTLPFETGCLTELGAHWFDQKPVIPSHFQVSTVIKHTSCCAWLLCIAARDSDPQVVQQGLYWPSSLCNPDNASCVFLCWENEICSYL